MVIRIVGLLVTMLVLIPVLTAIERWAIQGGWRFGGLFVLLGVALFAVRGKSGEDEPLIFEDRPAAAFELLKLA